MLLVRGGGRFVRAVVFAPSSGVGGLLSCASASCLPLVAVCPLSASPSSSCSRASVCLASRPVWRFGLFGVLACLVLRSVWHVIRLRPLAFGASSHIVGVAACRPGYSYSVRPVTVIAWLPLSPVWCFCRLRWRCRLCRPGCLAFGLLPSSPGCRSCPFGASAAFAGVVRLCRLGCLAFRPVTVVVCAWLSLSPVWRLCL